MKERGKNRSLVLVQTALSAGLCCLGAYLVIPLGVPVSCQTLVIFVTSGVFGWRVGVRAVACYLALGAVGLPVFAGGGGGLGVLFGASGGYLWGFLLIPLAMGACLGASKSLWRLILGMGTGLLLCYLLGSFYFYMLYAVGGEAIGLWQVVSVCVLPFLLPDAIKMLLSAFLIRRFWRHYTDLSRKKPSGS